MIKGLKQVKSVKKLYHLSERNQDGKCFHPRIPEKILEDEDTKYNRVCFSTNIAKCIKAIYDEYVPPYVLYVHVPINIEKIIERGGIYKPSDVLVPDVKKTNEHWCRRPVKMKCIGSIKCTKYKKYSKTYLKFNWIEKYGV